MNWMLLTAISGPMRAVDSDLAAGGIFPVVDAAARALFWPPWSGWDCGSCARAT